MKPVQQESRQKHKTDAAGHGHDAVLWEVWSCCKHAKEMRQVNKLQIAQNLSRAIALLLAEVLIFPSTHARLRVLSKLRIFCKIITLNVHLQNLFSCLSGLFKTASSCNECPKNEIYSVWLLKLSIKYSCTHCAWSPRQSSCGSWWQH